MDAFVDFVSNYGYLAVFLGTIVWGETIMVAAGFLASLENINLSIYLVIICGALGTLLADSFWYLVGHYGKIGSKFLEKYEFYVKRKPKVIEKIKVSFAKHSGKTIFFSKFIYGTRILVLIMAGMTGMKYRKFFIFNFFSVFFWAIGMALIGYYLGEGYIKLQAYFQQAEYVLLGVLILIILIRVIISLRIRFKNKNNATATTEK